MASPRKHNRFDQIGRDVFKEAGLTVIGQNIVYWQRKRQIKHLMLAELAQISVNTLTRIKSDFTGQWRFSSLLRVAVVLDVPVWLLLAPREYQEHHSLDDFVYNRQKIAREMIQVIKDKYNV